MKERPILFSGPMVRAILEGRKTQTRRVVKLPNHAPTSGAFWDHAGYQPFEVRPAEWGFRWKEWPTMMPADGSPYFKCPFGTAGDRLWVKETFIDDQKNFPGAPIRYVYRADHPEGILGPGWTPSIFCTRAASRITLEITSVRVERLNAISESDALAEGIDTSTCRVTSQAEAIADGRLCSVDYVDGYRKLWESINGAGSWAANPWVWVIGFRRIET
jgi:hypothetical protein